MADKPKMTISVSSRIETTKKIVLTNDMIREILIKHCDAPADARLDSVSDDTTFYDDLCLTWTMVEEL